jgi:hypothetical protein
MILQNERITGKWELEVKFLKIFSGAKALTLFNALIRPG